MSQQPSGVLSCRCWLAGRADRHRDLRGVTRGPNVFCSFGSISAILLRKAGAILASALWRGELFDCGLGITLATLGESIDDNKEHGHDEDRQHSGCDHSAKDRRS